MPTERRRNPTRRRQPVVLGIDANDDATTIPAYDYRKSNVYPYLRRRGLKVKLLRGQRASRKGAAAAAVQPDVLYLTGSGHGFANSFTGHGQQFIFQVGSYGVRETERKIAHFLSCNTAQQLGPDFVNHRCRAYFGYSVEFAWPLDKPEPFFRCDSEIDRALADGDSAGRALRRAVKKFNETIEELNLIEGNTYCAGLLEKLRDHLCGPSRSDSRYGDPEARLRPDKSTRGGSPDR